MIETRWDPLTNLTSRIIHFPKKKFEKQEVDIFPRLAPPESCPFCPENIEKMTSKFEKDLFGCERVREDGVTVIPNLLTFDKYCIVAIISEKHFPDILEIVENGYITKGIRVLVELLRRITTRDRQVKYMSINCNYMPMSGSSVLHPHVQAIAGATGTNYHRLMVEKSKSFFRTHGKVFWELLKECESEKMERFVGTIGKTFWYTPYAPKGNMDIGCIFSKSSILDLDETDLCDLETGLKRVIKYFVSENIFGYNFSLFSSVPGNEKSFRVNLRILGRRFLPPVGASDTNYFHTIHLETTAVFTPEEVAEGLRKYWN
ncbi:MAG: hypothetical protein NZ583_07085 [Desulfobacterota bacterium]|nr:hypothetical protein [Thermodesulfobacteriota bacterium]MDW8002158.1 hypothetical protein [Deltaproteobacteria bacterium]